MRQIVPPVLATLIAALLIAGFNRAFSGHLVQPRMAAMQAGTAAPDETVRPGATAVKPREEVTEIVAVSAPTAGERIFAKDDGGEAGKDQTSFKVATAPATLPAPASPAALPAPTVPRAIARKPEPVIEQRPVEPRVTAAPATQVPVIVAPAPMAAAPVIVSQPLAQPVPSVSQQPLAPAMQPVAQQPPSVITAKPVVTVPDRARPAYPANEAVAEPEGSACGIPAAPVRTLCRRDAPVLDLQPHARIRRPH